jgi:UDP-glucose 4-epimerase
LRRILVIGAGGFLGRAIVRAFSRAGVSVLATDRDDEDRFIVRPGSVAGLVDYTRRDLLTEPLDDLILRASGAIYAAAITAPDEGAPEVAERLLDVNLKVFLDVLAAMRASEACKRVLFISSSAVYDQSCEGVIHEADARGGPSLYAAAKLGTEMIAHEYAAIAGLDFCSVRPTSVIGPGEEPRTSRPRISRFARLLAAAREGRPVRLERGEARDDVIAVDDVAEAILSLWKLSRWSGESFSVSAGRTYSLNELAAAIARVTIVSVSPDGEVVDGGEDLPAIVSHERIARASGWRPRRRLEDVVQECLDFA